MLVQVVDELEHVALHCPGHGNVIDETVTYPHPSASPRETDGVSLPEMDDVFAQTDAARVWTDGNSKSGIAPSDCVGPQGKEKNGALGRHEQHAEHLADAREAARINLHDINRVGLQ